MTTFASTLNSLAEERAIERLIIETFDATLTEPGRVPSPHPNGRADGSSSLHRRGPGSASVVSSGGASGTAPADGNAPAPPEIIQPGLFE